MGGEDGTHLKVLYGATLFPGLVHAVAALLGVQPLGVGGARSQSVRMTCETCERDQVGERGEGTAVVHWPQEQHEAKA